jgi:1,4-alpha-glucan branching enzyme
MKKNYILIIACCFISFLGFSQVTISPSVFSTTDPITITVSFASTTCNTMGANPTKVYMHAGIGDATLGAFGYSVVGNWGLNDNVGLMTKNPNGTWSKTITPTTYFGLSAAEELSATKLGLVFRDPTGNFTLKQGSSCVDFIFNVGSFQAKLVSPLENDTSIITSGGNLAITANNTNGSASYNLFANGVSINTASGTNYSFNDTNITSFKTYDLQITQGAVTVSKKFSVIANPTTISQILPAGTEDGINYNSSDTTKATLVLDAPGKDFVYVAGSFNNYQPNSVYAMKKDPTTGKFWLELTGLISGTNYNYQYWAGDSTPFAGSPALVKTADPYSTLVLSPIDDLTIPSTSYPNIPAYPAGQEREVTVLQTGQTPYTWSSATTNFVKPAKEKLVVYEVLVRDFDANRNFQDLINRIDYFKNLKVNAIQLMPIMEFEGNESWGYNTSFHMALDKFYGTSNKLKEFIDLCHTNGIAVILDVALNHAFGRNPMVRMWMNDPDGNGWGEPSSDNPYFNTVAKHSYNVGSDFNHQQPLTKYYVKRVVKQWMQEYKIDGIRWDLTKGFTQNCTDGDDACTNSYQQDRVDVLKEYADYSWSLDPTHYIIFEHLGGDPEEQQWANYRINETPSKGVMMWGKMTDEYNQLSMGYNSNADISRIGHTAHGFTAKRVMGYPESHDEERLMYKNILYGNNTVSTHNVRNLNTALSRMSAIGAISLLVPGPKMVWHFGELGWNSSIFTCNNESVNTPSDATPGDCKLETKPQPQWTNNWLGNANRSPIYNDWAKMIDLKNTQPVFSGDYNLVSGAANLTPKLYVFDASIPASQLSNVVVLTNFDVISQNVVPNFPFTGTWYNLMDSTTINVANTTATITIPPGGYRVFGNQMATLGTQDFKTTKSILMYPNPVKNSFLLSDAVASVTIYNVTGQKVKTFQGNFDTNHVFNINDLKRGVYLVKITGDNNRLSTIKLVKE